MLLEYVPLLQVQRDLYTIPRGGTRFRAYLRTMIDPHTRDLRLPLVNMNPLGKDHVPQLIDELLSLDADGVARQAMEQAAAAQRAVAGSFRVALDSCGGATGPRSWPACTATARRKPSATRHRVSATTPDSPWRCIRRGRSRPPPTVPGARPEARRARRIWRRRRRPSPSPPRPFEPYPNSRSNSLRACRSRRCSTPAASPSARGPLRRRK